jgi:hypothetical protein
LASEGDIEELPAELEGLEELEAGGRSGELMERSIAGDL